MSTRFLSQTIAFVCFGLAATVAQAQTWTTLTNRPPAGVALCMLLTDGGVMCQSGVAWYKLTPDSSGSYVNGTWSSLASLPSGYDPDAFASAVLADGRVVIVGGEYNFGNFALTNLGAIYNPVTNTWATLSPPPSTGTPNHFQCIGDAPATVLADGRFMVGSKLFQDLAVLDPSTLTWSLVSATGKTDGFNSEEGWTLLPDGSVFTLDVQNASSSERFLPTGSTTGVWAYSGTTIQDLHTPTTSGTLNAPGCVPYNPPGEIGPTLLRPDGTVFAVGADGFTGVYTPPAAGSTATGSWAVGPAMPAGLNVEDGPGAVLPSGHVLFGGSPGASGSGLKYFESDGTSLISVPAPSRASSDATYFTSLLVLPSGQVMFVDSSSTVQLYTPAATPTYNAAWAPTISYVPTSLTNGTTYQITGTQFNGLDQGSAYGDESQNATNYPLVRITNTATGHVFYARTHGHTSMGVATGAATVLTNFDVPTHIDAGPSTIQVVANGILSLPVSVTVISTIVNSTATTVSSSPNPSSYGQGVTFTSTTTSSAGVPPGTVTFTEGATVLASGVTVNSSGHASFATAALGVGSHTITATYNGAAGWLSSSGNSAAQVVNKVSTTTTVSSSANPSVFSQSVTFTATVKASVAGGIPTGTVTFKNGGTTLGTGSLDGTGHATFSSSSLAVGSYTVSAVYAGSGNFNGSTSQNLNQKVNKDNTTTTVISSLNPSNAGQSVTFTATVSAVAPVTAVPTGAVTFKYGNKNLGNANLAGGQATFTTTTLPKGKDQITVVYGGATDFNTSTSTALAQTVN